MLAVCMHVSRRQLALVFAVVNIGCGDRLADLSEDELEPETVPVCMLLSGTLGHWEDGHSMIVWDPVLEQVGSICTCMTHERIELPTFEFRDGLDDLNDQMLVECERLSALIGFDWDECLEDYAAGTWRGVTYRAMPNDYWGYLVPDDLQCR